MLRSQPALRIVLPLRIVTLVTLAAWTAAGGAVSSLTPAFASSSPAVAEFDQCENGPASTPPPGTSCTGWTNGALQSTNSHYAEGDSVPQRLIISIPAGSSTTQSVTLTYDVRKGGIHAYDSLATWNVTVTGAGRCDSLSNGIPCPGGQNATPSTCPIPFDSTSEPPIGVGGNGSQVVGTHMVPFGGGRQLQMFGGILTSFSNAAQSPTALPCVGITSGSQLAYSHTTSSATSDDSEIFVVNYTVPVSGNTQYVELLFGGHLSISTSSTHGWGTRLGSSNISGGPYHVAVTALNDANLTNGGRDNQIQTGAILAPNLTIAKAADQSPVPAGSPIGFRITVSNPNFSSSSPAGNANSVVLSDPLPAVSGESSPSWTIAGYTITGYTPPSPAPCGSVGSLVSTLSCPLGNLPAGSSVAVHVTSHTVATDCSTYDNTATANADNDGPFTARASVSLTCAPVVTIQKTADVASVNAGDQVGFTVTLTNSGAGTASGLAVSDPLPGGGGISWSLDSANTSSGWSIIGTPPNQSLAYSPTTLAPGATTKAHMTSATTSSSCGSLTNTASFSSGNAGTGSDHASVTVNCALISVSKAPDAGVVNAGDSIGFTITVKNAGAGVAYGVQVNDALPTNSGLNWSIAGASPATGWSLSGGSVSYGPANLAPGGSLSVHITSPTTSQSCGTVNNTAEVTTTNSGGGSATAQVTVNCANVSVVKTSDAAAVSAGDRIGFTVSVSNTGAGTASGVRLTDSLPAGNAATPVHWTIDTGTGNPSAFAITGADGSQSLALAGQPVALAPGASLTVHVTAGTSSTSCATYDNSASVSTSNDGVASASASTAVRCSSPSLTKTAGSASVDAGSAISFGIALANGDSNDTGTATGVTLSDPLPAAPGVSWSVDSSTLAPEGVSCVISGSVPNQVLNCGTGSDGKGGFVLAPGGSVHVVVISATTTATCGSLSNTATASIPFHVPSTLSASASTTVRCVTSIATTPSAASGAVGIAVHDVARVSGAGSPTGSVSFALYGPGDSSCRTNLLAGSSAFSNLPLVNGSATSPDYTMNDVGVYQWVASYGGDAKNVGSQGACGDTTEQVITAAVLSETSLPPTGSLPLALLLSGLPLVAFGSLLRVIGRRRRSAA